MKIVVGSLRYSHELVARFGDPEAGGLGVGGMFGMRPESSGSSRLVAVGGLIRDVLTQLSRGLKGFWLGDLDFVRPALALNAAWEQDEEGRECAAAAVAAAGAPSTLTALTDALLAAAAAAGGEDGPAAAEEDLREHQSQIRAFVAGLRKAEVGGCISGKLRNREVLAAHVPPQALPEDAGARSKSKKAEALQETETQIRYNVFQARKIDHKLTEEGQSENTG